MLITKLVPQILKIEFICFQNGHRNSASSGGGSVSSNAPSDCAPHFAVHDERAGSMNGSCGAKDVHSDSELSSACSTDEIHKEHVINNPDIQ